MQRFPPQNYRCTEKLNTDRCLLLKLHLNHRYCLISSCPPKVLFFFLFLHHLPHFLPAFTSHKPWGSCWAMLPAIIKGTHDSRMALEININKWTECYEPVSCLHLPAWPHLWCAKYGFVERGRCLSCRWFPAVRFQMHVISVQCDTAKFEEAENLFSQSGSQLRRWDWTRISYQQWTNFDSFIWGRVFLVLYTLWKPLFQGIT